MVAIPRPGGGYLPVPRHAFVDSYGDTNLATEKDGTTGSFIIAAVVVPGERVDGLRAAVDAIRSRHFGTAELRSNKMDDARRLRVIKDLCELDFAFVALSIDKARVSRDGGLIYKEPFLKYSHRVLFERLYRAHPDLRVVADEHGYPEFMEGFRKYVEAQASPDLFRRPSFKFAKSHSDPLIQVADVIAGTLARFLDPKKHADNGEALDLLLRKRAIFVQEWPSGPLSRSAPRPGVSGHDALLRKHCLDQANRYLAKFGMRADDDPMPSVEALRFLLFFFNTVSENEYVPTGRLLEALAETVPAGSSEFQVRKIIATLRDNGVIVASSSKGYKIPSSIEDVMDFVDRYDSIVGPMVKRVRAAREDLLLLTDRELDILEGDRFEYLRRAAE